jgi:hypothetical protein
MRCSRRPRREVRRDGHAEYLRGCPRGPNGGAYALQGRCRAAPAGAITGQLSGWDGQVGQDRPGRSTIWPPRPASYICGIGADGLEVRNDDGEAACVVARCPGCFAGGSRPRLAGPRLRWPASRARRISTRRLLGAPQQPLATPRRAWMLRQVCAWGGPSALGGVGRSGPHTRPGTQCPASRRRFGERYRRSNPRQPTGWSPCW